MSNYMDQALTICESEDIVERVARLLADIDELRAAIRRLDRDLSGMYSEQASRKDSMSDIELYQSDLEMILKAIEFERATAYAQSSSIYQYVDFKYADSNEPLGYITDRASFKFGARE